MEDLVQLHTDEATAHFDRGDFAASIKHWRDALRLAQDDAEWHSQQAGMRYNYALALSGAGRTAEAIAEHQQAARLQPDFWQPHLDIGRIYQKARHWREASEFYRRVLEMNPQEPGAAAGAVGGLAVASYYIAKASKTLDDWQTAEDALRQAVPAHPDSLYFKRLAALVVWYQGDREAAFAQMKALAASEPLDIQTGQALARMQRWSGQWHDFFQTIWHLSLLSLRRQGYDENGKRLKRPELLEGG